jgi:hypothetical protein
MDAAEVVNLRAVTADCQRPRPGHGSKKWKSRFTAWSFLISTAARRFPMDASERLARDGFSPMERKSRL